MLSAILNGKGRRLPASLPAGASLRMAFVRSEDILTSTVFERLAYLDGPTLWNLLAATFRPRILPERKIADLEHIEFWPLWGQAKETLEAAVEPDVVLRFSVGDPAQEIVLIVECKLGGIQYPDQWAREWIAYRAENASDEGGSETYLLALGGLPANAEVIVEGFTETVRQGYGVDVKATAADWRDLLKALDEVEPVRPSDRRVVADVRAALALHGYSHFTPMSELGALAAGYRIASTGDPLRLIEDASAPERAGGEPPVRPARGVDLDPLVGWAKRVAPFQSLTDHRSLRWSDQDA